jgi:hypothetical protein
LATCPSEPRTAAGTLLAERRWVAALEERDKAALGCILDPSFVDTSWRGELISRAAAIEALPRRPSTILELSELKSQLIGNVAIVRGVNRQVSGTKIVGSVRFVDVFVYRSRRWQALSAEETLIQPGPLASTSP